MARLQSRSPTVQSKICHFWNGLSDLFGAIVSLLPVHPTPSLQGQPLIFRSIARHVLRKTMAALVYNFNISIWNGEKDRVEGYPYLATYPKKGHEGYLRVRLEPRFTSQS
jgi:hypothetical protein